MRRWLVETIATVAGALVFAFAFQTLAFATFYIPSESMVPTLQVGDRITASKFSYEWSRHSPAYDLTLPEAVRGRLFGGEPRRGDIVVFIHPRTGDRMIKRLIGLPGDRVAVRGGKVVLNGQPVPLAHLRSYQFREYQGPVVDVDEYAETLPGGEPHTIIIRRRGIGAAERALGDMAERQIPAGHYFMMGDNRDNSADSRFPSMGVVPAENLVARARLILYSWYSCAPEPGLRCADQRFGRVLE